MACGCKPTVTPGPCNRTINICRYTPLTVLAVDILCAQSSGLAITDVVGGIIYSISQDGKHIVLNSDVNTSENASLTYTYTCDNVLKECTLTIVVQDRIEGTHAIELNACTSTCSLGDTVYTWSGFTDGCVELMPGYTVNDCLIKVLVYGECEENLNNVITLEVCCGACLDGCCTTTTWTWNPPTFNDNCDADCSMYPCTVYDPASGNCVSTCGGCETCCSGTNDVNINLVHTCYRELFPPENLIYEYVVDIQSTEDTGQWILAALDDIAEGDNCLLVTDYEVFSESIFIPIDNNQGINFVYIDNQHMQIRIVTDSIPSGGGGFIIGYKVGDCTKYYTFQILAEEDQSPSNHCSTTLQFNEYYLEHNLLSDAHYPYCYNCAPSVITPYCAECCDDLGCQKENCVNQPICANGTCKCFLNGLEVPTLANGCCPEACVEDSVIPVCSTCVEGQIIPAPVCVAPYVLNTTTCLCECPPGARFSSLNPNDPCIPPTNCNVPGSITTCDPCENCVDGVCVPIPCGNVPGMVTNPTGNNTLQNPCCIPDPCPGCIDSLELHKYCTDILPRRVNVSADATNYRITFTQIQLAHLPFYSQTNCEYETLQAITYTNNLSNSAAYAINYTGYILDWVTATPSGNTLIIPQSAGNGFLLKCNWKGREVVYEFIFSEDFIGNATQLISGEYAISVKKVKELTCGNVYGLSGDCGATYSWEFTAAALNSSGQFITDNPIVVHPTGPNAEVCVNAITTSNGITCNETQVCEDIDQCEGGCGCDPCTNGLLYTTINQVTISDALIYYASVFRDCGNGDELPLMYTCAPPTSAEYNAYISSNGLTLPDGCGTLPQMFSSKPACANCADYTCTVPGEADPATQLCGWWINTDLLVADSLHINGANIEFEILASVETLELCFGVNTECGYVCSCTVIENPTYDPEAPCNFTADVTSNCTDAGYVQNVVVNMVGGIAPYTIQYNIDVDPLVGANINILPAGYNNGSLTVVTSQTSHTLMGFGVDVQDGCLLYNITVTDSSTVPCSVTLTNCIPCSAPACTVTAALQTTCTDNDVYSTVTIGNIVVGGVNSNEFNISGVIGVKDCADNVTPVWSLNMLNQTGPNITIPLNGNNNHDVLLLDSPGCDYTEKCVYYELTITDSSDGDCRTTITDCINCPPLALSYDCVSGNCQNPGDGSGEYTGVNALFNCKSSGCGSIYDSTCGTVVTIAETPGNTSTIVYDLGPTGANLTNLQTAFIEVAQGGKPEKYRVYQVKPDGTRKLILDSPHLGCGCAGVNKSLNGFWSNIKIDSGGAHIEGTPASALTPFIFELPSAVTWPFTDYASVNYSTYVSGATNKGYTHNFVPNNCTWIHELNSDCSINSTNADYNTCNTANCQTNPIHAYYYEKLNALALSRFYFQYIASEGDILEIEVEHGIFESSCNPYGGLSHGIKFKLICEEVFIPEANCIPLSGVITPSEPEEVSDRYVYTPVCANTLNSNINLGITVLNESNAPNISNAPMYENVVNVGYGYKYSNGKKTNEKAYIYQVNKKLDKAELKPHQIIPKTINGIKTDVVEMNKFDANYYDHISSTFNKSAYLNGNINGGATYTNAVVCSGDTVCYDAMLDGSSNANCACTPSGRVYGKTSPNHNSAAKSNNMVYGGLGVYVYNNSVVLWRGTISFIAKETSTGKLVGVTNNHVLGGLTSTVHSLQNTSFNYNYRLGCNATEYVGSCTGWANQCSTQFGTDYKAVAFVADNSTPNYVDIGLIQLQPDFAATDIHEIGYGNFPWVTENMFTNISEFIGLTVYKSGATTGTKIAIGEISTVGFSSGVNGTNRIMANQMLITPISNSTACENVLSLGGDSGSPILIELYGQLHIIGVLWGDSAYFPDPVSVFSPIWEVAARAGIEPWTGEIVTTSNSPFIRLTKNQKQYVKGSATNAAVTHTTFTEHNTQEQC